MKIKQLICCLLVLALAGVTASGAQAGDKQRRGTAGAQYLLLPLTARTTALGSSATGGMMQMNGIEALYVNPAGLVATNGTSALFSRMNYVADIGVNYFGVGHSFGSNTLALTVSSMDFGDIPLQTENEPEISPDLTWDASMVTVGLSYARQFTDRIAAGVTFKLLSESIDDMQASGLTFDAGMNYVAGESGFRFGVSLKNFGPEMTYTGTGLVRDVTLPGQRPDAKPVATRIQGSDFELPSLLNFGVSYTRDIASGAVMTVLGNFRSNSFSQDQFAGGLELGIRNILFLRGGYEWEEDMDLTMWEGYNVGAGLNLDLSGTAISIDYAYRGTQYFDGVQMITASLSL